MTTELVGAFPVLLLIVKEYVVLSHTPVFCLLPLHQESSLSERPLHLYVCVTTFVIV